MSACCCSTGPTHRFMSAQGGKAAYLSAHDRGGSGATRCALELSETQRGGRQDLGGGGRFLMSQLGRGIIRWAF